MNKEDYNSLPYFIVFWVLIIYYKSANNLIKVGVEIISRAPSGNRKRLSLQKEEQEMTKEQKARIDRKCT